MTHALVVHCPACAAGYLLSRSLLGPLGARVTCPQCRDRFDVDAGGERASGTSDDSAPRTPERGPDVHSNERRVAREVLDDVAARLGDEVAAAAREGRLFRDHGRELLGAFDEYRQRAGSQADARVFREALLRRWQVDLLPMAGAGAERARRTQRKDLPDRPGRL